MSLYYQAIIKFRSSYCKDLIKKTRYLFYSRAVTLTNEGCEFMGRIRLTGLETYPHRLIPGNTVSSYDPWIPTTICSFYPTRRDSQRDQFSLGDSPNLTQRDRMAPRRRRLRFTLGQEDGVLKREPELWQQEHDQPCEPHIVISHVYLFRATGSRTVNLS
jgi:hypothetical protein